MERDFWISGLALNFFDFNSHAHVERDYWTKLQISKGINFNSHAHVERDVKDKVFDLNHQISTHTLTWSVTQAT